MRGAGACRPARAEYKAMAQFEIIPAVDIKGGRCVRLRQGMADAETVYSDSPVEAARRWFEEGARRLHVVDLDGAFQGRLVHTSLILEMAAHVGIPVEVGGGIRTRAEADLLLANGVACVIIGTGVFESAGALREWAGAYGERLAVGIDAKGGRVRIKGWTVDSGASSEACVLRAADAGVRRVIYTDIALDGMMRGPNLGGIEAVCRAAGVDCMVTASGGISSGRDISALRRLGLPNLTGAIVGKALYEGKVTLAELLAAAQD